MTAATAITTSWDDGHPLDLRVAELLAKHGLPGTFYVPMRAEHGTMTTAQLRELSGAFEIGAHTVHHVDLKPGETASISVAAPTSTIAVVTSAPAEIWIDGARAGDAPLAGLSVAVGTHEIVAKASNGDERRSVVTVTVTPLTVEIDFAKP